MDDDDEDEMVVVMGGVGWRGDVDVGRSRNVELSHVADMQSVAQ